MEKYLAAVIQLDTQEDKGKNLADAASMIDEAASKGAKLVSLPETMTYIGDNQGVLRNAESIGGETTKLLCEKAKQYGIWLHGGSFYEKIEAHDKVYNTTVLVNPKGEVAALYRKIHLYDVEVTSGPSLRESDVYKPGEEVVVLPTEIGCLGLTICYDIRFPEIYRIMTLQGAQVFFTPASFTLYTGRDHWEPILRCRAIENGCYLLAANQVGKKRMFQSHGKSMIIDPWGNILAMAGDFPCVSIAEIDLNYVQSVRKQVPALLNRQTKVYDAYDGIYTGQPKKKTN